MDDIEQRFLDAIAANPDDEEARTVYADWLEERGDPRGEYLRLELQLYKIPLRLLALEGSIDSGWRDAVSRMLDVQLGDPGPNKIGVIKAVREITGLGLKDAKDLVVGASDKRPVTIRKRIDRAEADSIAATLAASGAMFQIVGHSGRRYVPPEPRVAIVLRSVDPAHRIDAIKLVRELGGLGLMEARDLIDNVLAGSVSPTLAADVTMDVAARVAARFEGIGVVTLERHLVRG